MTDKRVGSGVVKGVLILTFAGVMVKTIGVFYKVPLAHLLGDEGMGYFNISYTIYAWLYMLSTAGIPVALSILISEARARGDGRFAQRVFRISAIALVIFGALSSLVMSLGAEMIADMLGSNQAKYTIFAIAPTLFFVSLSSLFRGLFQGYGNMLPTAMSQLTEAVGKVVFGMLFAELAIRRGFGTPMISAYAVFGVTAGTACSVVYLALHYIYARARGAFLSAEHLELRPKGRPIAYRLFAIAFPVTVSASVMSLTGLIDLGMIIRRLTDIGYTHAEATALYGNYTTLVVPLFNLPSVLIAPVATGIIPALSRAYAAGEKEACERILAGAFRAVGVLAVPCAVGLALFARPILALMYPPPSVESAYKLLIYLTPAVVFLCLLSLVNASLQACGRSRIPMISMLIGGGIKIAAGYVLLAEIGIAGSPVGTLLCYLAALSVGFYALEQQMSFLPSVASVLIKPLLSSIVSIGSVAMLYYRLPILNSHRAGIVIAVSACVIIYVILSVLTGVITREDLAFLAKRGTGKGNENELKNEFL